MDSQIQLPLSCRNKRGALLPPSRMNGGVRMAPCRCHPTSCPPENQGRKIVCPCRLEPGIQIRVARAKVSIFATQLHDTVDARWHWLIGRCGYHTGTGIRRPVCTTSTSCVCELTEENLAESSPPRNRRGASAVHCSSVRGPMVPARAGAVLDLSFVPLRRSLPVAARPPTSGSPTR